MFLRLVTEVLVVKRNRTQKVTRPKADKEVLEEKDIFISPTFHQTISHGVVRSGTPFSFSFTPPAGLHRHYGDPLSTSAPIRVHRECPQPSLFLLSFTYWFRAQYLRITLNNVTLFFFFFSLLHCFAQGILQSFLYTADDTWGSITSQIVARAQINSASIVFPQFTGRHGDYSLELCNQVPVLGGMPDPCAHFFTAGQPDPITIPQRFLPPGTQASDPGASFVRQPFLSFFSILLNIFDGSLPTLPLSQW